MYKFITFYVFLVKTVYIGHACENKKMRWLVYSESLLDLRP